MLRVVPRGGGGGGGRNVPGGKLNTSKQFITHSFLVGVKGVVNILSVVCVVVVIL